MSFRRRELFQAILGKVRETLNPLADREPDEDLTLSPERAGLALGRRTGGLDSVEPLNARIIHTVQVEEDRS